MGIKPSGMLDGFDSCYAILQLKESVDKRLHFLGFRQLADVLEMVPNIENYAVVYLKELPEDFELQKEDLEKIYYIFNMEHPEDFKGHSLSVGDIVAFKFNGKTEYHYVDSFGFVSLVDFEKPVIQIGNHSCHLVDEFQVYDGNIIQLGNIMDGSGAVFFFAMIQNGNYVEEYDYRPSRKEMEDDYIAEMADRELGKQEERSGAGEIGAIYTI